MCLLRARLDRRECCLYFLTALPGLCLAGQWALAEQNFVLFWVSAALIVSLAFFVPEEQNPR